MILSPSQQHALDKLLPVARIATDGSRVELPLNPRTHSLIVGPSGCGKSFLARRIAEELKLPCMVVNVSSWMIQGERGSNWTFNQIVEWLATLQGGGVLVLDEIDKAGGGESGGGVESEWKQHIRLELHDLLDFVIPPCVSLPSQNEGGAAMSATALWEETIEYLKVPPRDERQWLCDQLRHRVFVVGCGAWQGAWKTNTRSLGFSTTAATLPEPPSRQQILGSIDPELRLRFRDEIAVLPPMIPEDYAAVARKLVTKIPLHARPHWDKLIGKAIMEAAAGCLGMRMFEELVLKAMVLSRSEVPCQELE